MGVWRDRMTAACLSGLPISRRMVSKTLKTATLRISKTGQVKDSPSKRQGMRQVSNTHHGKVRWCNSNSKRSSKIKKWVDKRAQPQTEQMARTERHRRVSNQHKLSASLRSSKESSALSERSVEVSVN